MTSLWLFIKHIITSEYLSLLLRIYLGFIFIYASMSKLSSPAAFAEAIAFYQIVPYWFVNFFAVVLPWIEFVCGFFLIIGLRTRSVTCVISLLLIIFTVGILINLMRGVPIDCGCFSNAGNRISWWDMLRDLLWLLFAVQIFFYDRVYLLRRKGLIGSTIEPIVQTFISQLYKERQLATGFPHRV